MWHCPLRRQSSWGWEAPCCWSYLASEAFFTGWCWLVIPACLRVVWVLLRVTEGRRALRVSGYPGTSFSFPSWVWLSCFIKKCIGVLIAFGCAEAEKKTCWWNQILWDAQTAHDTLHHVWQSLVLQNLKQRPVTSKRLSAPTSSYTGSQWCRAANDDSSTASWSVCAVMWHVMSPPSFWCKLTTPWILTMLLFVCGGGGCSRVEQRGGRRTVRRRLFSPLAQMPNHALPGMPYLSPGATCVYFTLLSWVTSIESSAQNLLSLAKKINNLDCLKRCVCDAWWQSLPVSAAGSLWKVQPDLLVIMS